MNRSFSPVDTQTQTFLLKTLRVFNRKVCILKIRIPDEEPKPKESRPDFSWLDRDNYLK